MRIENGRIKWECSISRTNLNATAKKVQKRQKSLNQHWVDYYELGETKSKTQYLIKGILSWNES